MAPFDLTNEERLGVISRYVSDPDEQVLYAHWFDVDSADWWRHYRMYEIADCLSHLEYKWLTIGDGRFGLDSLRLGRKGVRDVTPTDISGDLLEASKKEGWIADYRVEDAEKLSLPDRSVDVVFCKESYHHLPHPQIGLYEMLRVAREVVILVEPNDKAANHSVYSTLRQRKLIAYAAFEPAGNYVYQVSRREIVKTAIVANMTAVAFKGINDYYEKGIEFERADPRRSKMYKRARRLISLRNVLSRLHLLDYNINMAAMFRNEIDHRTLSLLKNAGWTVVRAPKNPYQPTDQPAIGL